MHGAANSAGTHRSAGATRTRAHRSTVALISTCAARAACAGALEDWASTRSDRSCSRRRCVNGARSSLRHNHATYWRSIHNGSRWWRRSCHFGDRLRCGSRCYWLWRDRSSRSCSRSFHDDRSHRNAGSNSRCRRNDDRRSGTCLRNDAAARGLRCRGRTLRGERQRRHDRLRVGRAHRRSHRSWRRYRRSRASHNHGWCWSRGRSHQGPCHNRSRGSRGGRRRGHHGRWRNHGGGRSGRCWRRYSHYRRPGHNGTLSKGRRRSACGFCLFALENSARDISWLGGLGEIDSSTCICGGGRTGVGRATIDVASHELGFARFNGARMGLLFCHAHSRQSIQDGFALHFKLACQVINAYFAQSILVLFPCTLNAS